MSEPSDGEQLHDLLQEQIERLNAKPWRGGCPLCQFTLWCTDTEQEARDLVTQHIAEQHTVQPQVWMDHEASTEGNGGPSAGAGNQPKGST